jgi:tetratricopeptide (TPR) repeat protein
VIASTVAMPAFAVSAQIATDQVQAPWSLTATDGSGLILTRVEAKAVFEGPLAFTELHLHFHNPEDRVREGTFAITLPNRAAVSRFAMENNGQWMEAEVVEKLKARRAYEDFLHRKQDPALLEKAEGNQFTARVFPIPAKGDKHLVLSFSQELPGERYTLPLRGLPKIDRVDVRMQMLGSDGRKIEQLLTERAWQPDRDFVSNAPVNAEAVGTARIVAAQLAVMDPSGAMPAADAPTAMTILVDTSASRTLGFASTAAQLDKMIGELRRRHGDELRLQVVAYDQETQLMYAGRAADWGAKAKQAVLDRGAAGASDLGQAIAWLGKNAPHQRLVILGDGVITAGAKPEQVAAAIKQLRGVERVDMVLSGGIRDDQVATQLVRAASRPGAVLDLDTGSDGVVAALAERMLTDVAIEVKGATWVYPKTIASARAGTRVMVYAKMPGPTQTLDVSVNNHRRAVAVLAGTGPLVERATAAAEIGELETKLANATTNTAALKDEIARRSVAARVISSQTSLLVLESEADYDRYGIDRAALADILEVGPAGLVTRNRKGVSLQIAKAPERPAAKKKVMKELQQRSADDGGEELRIGDGDDADDKPTEELSKREERPASFRSRSFVDGRPGGAPGAGVAPAPEPAVSAPPPPALRDRVVNRPPAAERRRVAPRSQIADESDSEGAADIDDDDYGANSREAWPPKNKPAALQGELAEIAKLIAKRDLNAALTHARAWHAKEPGNVLAWIGLGEALEARKEPSSAARAYGSIIDLFPGRADLRRWAGERLERIGAGARELAIDSYRRAVADRPDHMTGHRLLAYALLRAGKHADAFAAILAGVAQKYPDGRFEGGDRILREDAGLIGAAYAASLPNKRGEIAAELGKRGLAIANGASTRFILYWETDANDVDFHIQDARGGHAFYSNKKLPSGGELYADVTTGYGPECFAIPGNTKAGPYRLSIDYYSQGPMGYGMGLLQIVRHDGKGKLAFEDRPYIIMADHAYVDLGSFK